MQMLSISWKKICGMFAQVMTWNTPKDLLFLCIKKKDENITTESDVRHDHIMFLIFVRFYHRNAIKLCEMDY